MAQGVHDQAAPARSAAAWAQHQILDLIGSGDLQAGQRLPAERDLSTRLGVSRASAREAIASLVTMGVLEARHGAGVYVTELDPVALLSSFGPVLSIIADHHEHDLVRLHAEVEAASAARAAARATGADLGPLQQALEELRLADVEPQSRHADDRFRSTIWQLSDQRFHRAIAHLAQDAIAEGMAALLRATRERRAEGASTRDLAAHLELARAITDRDPALAASAARRLVRDEFPVAPAAAAKGTTSHDEQPTTTGSALVSSRAEPSTNGSLPLHEAPAWFRDAKLGLIVHWGLYSVPGWAPVEESAGKGSSDDRFSRPQHPFAEWYQSAAALPGSRTAEYHQRTYGGTDYGDFRGPFEQAVESWDPNVWTRQFSQAGARYVVQVAKHHDGYLLWPSRVRHPTRSDWRTSRDVVGELATAVRTAGLRYGIFYSSGVDWSFRSSPPVELADVLTSSPPGVDYARYVEAQWRELIASYLPDGLWNDTGYPAAGDARRLLETYYSTVPDGMVSDRFRVAAPGLPGGTTAGGATGRRPWESIRPLGRSFGWNRLETSADVLSGSELVLLLLDVVTTDRNLLLGVSPDDRGNLPDTQARSLADLGEWLHKHGEAVYGSTAWTMPRLSTTSGRSVYLTWHGDALYVTVEGPVGGEVVVEGLRLDAAAEAALVHSHIAVEHRATDRGTSFVVPGDAPTDAVATALVIEHPWAT